MLGALLASPVLHGQAAPPPAPSAAETAVREFVVAQTRGLPGRVEVLIDKLPPGTASRPCASFGPAVPAGSRLWGKTVVALNCLAPASWVVYVPLEVRVHGKYLATARAIPGGQAITSADLVLADGVLSALPDGTLTEAQAALGHRTRVGLTAGMPLATQHLLVPPAVQQGQTVKVIARGSGFAASSEGVALATVAVGERVRVRMASGQTVSGVARADGSVELAF